MTLKVTHTFVSAKADGSDSTVVRPSNWNEDHQVESETTSIYLGRAAAGAGPIQELPIESGSPTDDFTLMTKEAVEAAIAAALVGIDFGETGDLAPSLRTTKSGWLLLNGQTIGKAGSTAVYAQAAAEDLFKLFWAINGNSWAVLNASGTASRGLSAQADWDAAKKIALPDARGYSLTMIGNATVNPLVTALGLRAGVHNHKLTAQEMFPHTHTSLEQFWQIQAAGPGGTVTGSDNNFKTVTLTPFGGDPASGTPPTNSKAFSMLTPTMGVNIFIKL